MTSEGEVYVQDEGHPHSPEGAAAPVVALPRSRLSEYKPTPTCVVLGPGPIFLVGLGFALSRAESLSLTGEVGLRYRGPSLNGVPLILSVSVDGLSIGHVKRRATPGRRIDLRLQTDRRVAVGTHAVKLQVRVDPLPRHPHCRPPKEGELKLRRVLLGGATSTIGNREVRRGLRSGCSVGALPSTYDRGEDQDPRLDTPSDDSDFQSMLWRRDDRA